MRSEQTLPLVVAQPGTPTALNTNRVLCNTYGLLSVTLFFSAAIAATSAALKLPHPGIVLTLIGFFGLLYATTQLRNSGWGLAAVFGLTGFNGLHPGPGREPLPVDAERAPDGDDGDGRHGHDLHQPAGADRLRRIG